MAVLNNTGILAGASGAGGDSGYQIEKSLRFNDDDTPYLNRTPSSSTTNQKQFTFSFWAKPTSSSGNRSFFACGSSSQVTGMFQMWLESGRFIIYGWGSGYYRTNARYRDPSAFYHFVVAVDSNLATTSDIWKLWVNGVRVTDWYTETDPAQNNSWIVNTTTNHEISGIRNSGGTLGNYWDGYLAEYYLIDGQALTASDFGETNATTGQWVPKDCSEDLTYGTNGFYLKFNNTSDLGEDSSGNGNDWTANNLSTTAGADNDSLTDTPTPFDDGGNGTGNYATLNPLNPGASTLSNGNLDASGTGDLPTIIPGSGQWYYEIDGTGYDWDGTVADFTDAAGSYNFGQRPFEGTVTTGYKALNTYNLDDPTIAIPSKHFDSAIDDGDDILTTALDLTDGADFVWIKDRDNTDDHILFNRINDTGMDGTPHMRSNETDDESTCGTYSAPSGNSVAWVWNAGTTNVFNDASATGVGSIDSTYRANPSAGFSIVSYTGTGSVGTIAHGLNAKIDFAIFKNREDTQSWAVYHKEMGNTHYIKLDEGIVPVDDVNAWNDTDPTSSIMTLGSNTSVNASTEEIVAYMWSEVEGYSKFGKFIGNGAADGPFIYCGFKPAFIMFGPNVNYSDWYIYDNERWPHNPAEDPLAANETMTEANFDARPITNHVDILSNGFKLRFADTSGYHNYSTWTYSFVAFADSSFKYSNAR